MGAQKKARRPNAPTVIGAASAKRAQLQRKAQREGLHDQHYINKYSEQRKEKKRAREQWIETAQSDEDVPPHLLRSWPVFHAAKSTSSSSKSRVGPRIYGTRSERTLLEPSLEPQP